MTAQAPVVQGAVSEALSEQHIAFGADLWRCRNVSEAEIPLSRPPGSREANALFSLARALGEGQ